MLALITANLWNGFGLRMSAAETVLYVLTMLCIGFIEAILFRGYLLQMLRESSTTLAILISSLTFGLGHIVNLLNGAAVLDTALQLIYAFSIGMMLSVFVVKRGTFCRTAYSMAHSMRCPLLQTDRGKRWERRSSPRRSSPSRRSDMRGISGNGTIPKRKRSRIKREAAAAAASLYRDRRERAIENSLRKLLKANSPAVLRRRGLHV